MLPALLPLFLFLFGDDATNQGKTVLDYLVEKGNEFLEMLLSFYKPLFDVLLHGLENAYAETFTTFTDFIMALVNRQSDDFSNNGRIFVNGIFSAINFQNADFTSNFLFWFIGLLVFAFCAKIFFKFTFGLLKTLLDAIFNLF